MCIRRNTTLPPGGGVRGNVWTCPCLRGGVGGVGFIPEADTAIRLWAFLPFNNIELDLVAFFQRLVPIKLDCRVVDEYIRSVLTSDESVALGVVEPLNLSFVLSHRFLPSFFLWNTAGPRRISCRC